VDRWQAEKVEFIVATVGSILGENVRTVMTE